MLRLKQTLPLLMPNLKRWISYIVRAALLAVFLAAFALAFPTAILTWRLASSTNGLITIALLQPAEWTFNPLSPNGIFISPDAAKWVLMNTDFAYRSCKQEGLFGCDISVTSWIGRALTLSHTPEERARALELLRHVIARGESVNKISQGVTPLHEAVMWEDLEYLDILLRAGADPRIRADHPSKLAGLTPYEFCVTRAHKGYSKVISLCERLKVAEMRE